MKTNLYEFYAKHYREIGDLLGLERDVCDKYPQEVGDFLRDAVEDHLATKFAGKEDWECDYDVYERGWREVSWSHKSFDDKLYFGIADLREAVSHERSVKGLIHCYLGTEDAKRATKIHLQKQRSHISRLKKLGYQVNEGDKEDWWFARRRAPALRRRVGLRPQRAAECTTGHARGGAGPSTGACRSRAAALLLDLARLRRFSGSPFLVAIGGIADIFSGRSKCQR